MVKNLINVFIISLFISCEIFDNRLQYKQINSNTEINIIVNNIKAENGEVFNNEYYFNNSDYIQYDTIPSKKIIENLIVNKKMNSLYEDGELSIGVSHIKPPFLIKKASNSNILYLVKNKDTLQFLIN
jgi:hypothetical protein